MKVQYRCLGWNIIFCATHSIVFTPRLFLDLVNEADEFLSRASGSFDNLRDSSDRMDNYKTDFESNSEENQQKIEDSYNRMYDASNHAADLERQVRIIFRIRIKIVRIIEIFV